MSSSFPPPLPRPPLAPRDVKEADTEPGVFSTADAMRLRQENIRLERQVVALTRSLAELESLPPPLFSEVGSRKRRARKVGIELGKFAVLLPVAGLLLRAAAKQWPEFGGLIEGALEALGL